MSGKLDQSVPLREANQHVNPMRPSQLLSGVTFYIHNPAHKLAVLHTFSATEPTAKS